MAAVHSLVRSFLRLVREAWKGERGPPKWELGGKGSGGRPGREFQEGLGFGVDGCIRESRAFLGDDRWMRRAKVRVGKDSGLLTEESRRIKWNKGKKRSELSDREDRASERNY